MRIVVVGAGVVGSATGKGFALRGHAVSFVDTNVERVDALRAEGLDASTTLDLGGPPALVMVTVPTPSDQHGYDLSAIRAASESIGDALREADDMTAVALRCTVAPGTLEHVVQPIIERRSERTAGVGFMLASNPEFLRARCALEDFLNPRMTVVASRFLPTRQLLVELYRPFGGEIRIFADPAEAEFVKLAHNIFNATKISFFNELWTVATKLGLDAGQTADIVVHSAEASWNPSYGTRGGRPFGGACLPKDVAGFIGFAHELGFPATMAEAVLAVNDEMGRTAELPLIDLCDPIVELTRQSRAS